MDMEGGEVIWTARVMSHRSRDAAFGDTLTLYPTLLYSIWPVKIALVLPIHASNYCYNIRSSLTQSRLTKYGSSPPPS